MKKNRPFEKYLTLSLALILFAAPLSSEELKMGHLSGVVMTEDDQPMAGGIVLVYNVDSGPPPAPEKYWRVPDEIAEIDEKGVFSLEIPGGRYYIGGLKKLDGENIGPAEEGDYFFISRDNNGDLKAYVIKDGEDIDTEINYEAVPFHMGPAGEITAVEGTLVDRDGKPFSDAIVFAYTTDEITGTPLFVSGASGADGSYTLRVHKGGSYYLRVRDMKGGGAPNGGPLISGYGATPVSLKSGEVKKAPDITVHSYRKAPPVDGPDK